MRQFFKDRDGSFATVDCSDWMDFKNKIQQVALYPNGKENGKFLFRGQGCSSWGLTSSFDRKFGDLPPAELDSIYLRRMKLFEKNFSIYGNMAKDSRGIQLRAQDFRLCVDTFRQVNRHEQIGCVAVEHTAKCGP